MKFQHTATREDGGGTLRVEAENAAEVIEVADHFRLFNKEEPSQLIGLAEAIKQGSLIYESSPDRKRPWYLITDSVQERFLEPYARLLDYTTGYHGKLPDLDLTGDHPRRLCHTHHTFSCHLTGHRYHFVTCVSSEDWNGMVAADRAIVMAIDYTEEELGFRPSEREYKENKNGTYSPNPNYLKRHRAQPATGAPWLWNVLFQWWREHVATPGQTQLLQEADAAKKAARLTDPDYTIRYSGGEAAHLVGCGGIYVSYKEPVRFVKWEDFKLL